MVFTSLGFHIKASSEDRGTMDLLEDRVLVKDAPYLTVYGTTGRSEFLAHDYLLGLSVRIECKWQGVPGSVDEKFPYIFMNATDTMKENEIVIILGGNGAKSAAKRWLKDAAKSSKVPQGKTIHVFSLEEFTDWAGKRFIR